MSNPFYSSKDPLVREIAHKMDHYFATVTDEQFVQDFDGAREEYNKMEEWLLEFERICKEEYNFTPSSDKLANLGDFYLSGQSPADAAFEEVTSFYD